MARPRIISSSLANASSGWWSALGVLALGMCVVAVSSWEGRWHTLSGRGPIKLQAYAADGGGSSGTPHGSRSSTFQQILDRGDTVSARYGFLNFNGDALELGFVIPKDEWVAYEQDYGYSQTDVEDLHAWQNKALDDAYQAAVKNRWDQARLDARSAQVQGEFHEKFQNLLRSRGFKILSETLIAPDIPGIVRRNVGRLRPVALELNQAAATRRYDSGSIVGAALALVQTALKYENVPVENQGRTTGGILPPVTAMATGLGDCDSKSALLASILLNWNQVDLVGLGVPNHYLLGYLQNPAKGEAYVDYRGLRYVLLEPAGPAWLAPGTIAATTLELLNAGNGLSIEPLTAL